jgi:hypothetical protein
MPDRLAATSSLTCSKGVFRGSADSDDYGSGSEPFVKAHESLSRGVYNNVSKLGFYRSRDETLELYPARAD